MTKVYPSFVTPSRAAEVFDVSTQTLRRWAKEGKIGFIKTPGGQYRYNVEGVIGLIQAVPDVKKPKAHPAKAKPVTVKPVAAAPVAPIEMPKPAPRPAMPTGVEMRSVDDEPEVAMRDIDAPSRKPAPKVEVARAPMPKLDAAALMQKIEGLATASAV